jgi:heme/copper-type cytochrome/quinol oxidase subunit 4
MEEIVKYLGNFHPVVLHLPIGAFLFTLLLFAYQKFTNIKLTIPIRLGLIFSFISAIVSSILGFILQFYGEYDNSLVNFHMWLAIITTLLIGLIYFLHKKNEDNKYIAHSFVSAVIFMTVTGHYGGSITHGKDYLKLPEINQTVRFVSYDSIHVYNDVVSTIIDSKCVKCHNMSKSKGGLMLTSEEQMNKGGENGKIFLANNSSDSKLYTYLNLPLNDKMHMPPDGNSQLTENEKNIIKMWIDSGAQFDGFTKIVDDDYSNEILNYLPPLVKNVDPPSKNSLIKLIENNFRIERISIESNFIDLKYDGKSFGSKQFNLLLKVSENIQRLDLSNIDFSMINSTKLKKLKNLKYLNLTNTNFNSEDLYSIPETVQILILSKNNIEPENLLEISSRPQLKKVFAYNTVSDHELKKSLADQSNNKIYFGISLQDFSSLEGFPLEKPIIEANGIEINPNPITDINPKFNRTLFVDSISVKVIEAISQPLYRYTTDETQPDSLSSVYNGPLVFTKSGNFNVKAFKKGYRTSIAKSFYFDKIKSRINSYNLLTKAIDPYNNDILFDGQLASLDFRDGKWNGFIHEEDEEKAKQQGRIENSGNLIVDFELPLNKNISEIAISCMESINNGFILLPETISLYDITDDDEELISYLKIPKSTVGEADSKRVFKLSLKSQNIQKVRLKIESNRKLPKGHVAEGQPGWLFIDEIYVL